MAEPTARQRGMVRYEEGRFRDGEDEIVTEYPLTLVLNGEQFATLVCSPDHAEDLAVGFLASEGVLADASGIRDIGHDERSGFVYVEADGVDEWLKESGNARYLTSCCGKSRQSFVFYSDARTARHVTGRAVRLGAAQCIAMMERMQEGSGLFRATGGVHNAALFRADGELLLARQDIGRHNALDKIYGYSLRNRIEMEGTVLAFSGRVSSEVALKASKMGCEVLLSKSAATELAIDLAEELGFTIVGFIRGSSFNVYSHPDRIHL